MSYPTISSSMVRLSSIRNQRSDHRWNLRYRCCTGYLVGERFNLRLGSWDALSLDLGNGQNVGRRLVHPFGQGEFFQRRRSPNVSCVGLQGRASSPMLREVDFCRRFFAQK